MQTRRNYLKATVAITAGLLAPRALSDSSKLPAQARTSDLIYLTPIQTNGRESSCQAEVWFVTERDDLYVITAADAWRARAARSGLEQTRIWVGDVGEWDDSARYKALPEVMASASIVGDEDTHARVLDIFGDKYPVQWLVWGPRFRKGLADGSRVLLRYEPV